jgi:hypothetical protein
VTDDLAHLSFDVQTAARAIIERTILDHPRSAQAEIGASEIGTACSRKLAYKLSGTPRIRAEEAAWRPTVGTAVHAWLEAAFRGENERLGWDRWIIERRVVIGPLNDTGRVLAGHCDLFDRLTGTVLDWKVPGVTTIKKAKAARSPGPTYRVQSHCYGLGWQNEGETVNAVAVYFLPAAGELADGYYWSEPFDASVATAALDRARALLSVGELRGWPSLIPTLPTAEDYCNHCAWWRPGSQDPAVACPGEAIPTSPRTTKFDPHAAFGRVSK